MAKDNDDDTIDSVHGQGLSQEELAALQDDTDGDDEAALNELAEGGEAAPDDQDDTDEDDEDDADDGPETKAVKDVADNKPAAADEAGSVATEDDDIPDDEDSGPEVFIPPPVENFDQKMADFDAQKKELRTQFQDGDIDLDKYEEQKDTIAAQEQSIREQQFKHQIATEQKEFNANNDWIRTQKEFLADGDNAVYQNKLVLSALDTAVKDLAFDPANAERTAGWFIKMADRQVRAAFGLAAAKPAAVKADAPAAKPGLPSRKPNLSNIPPNLGALPAADINETGSEEFSYLESLEGMKLEVALRKLTPEQEARYLAAA